MCRERQDRKGVGRQFGFGFVWDSSAAAQQQRQRQGRSKEPTFLYRSGSGGPTDNLHYQNVLSAATVELMATVCSVSCWPILSLAFRGTRQSKAVNHRHLRRRTFTISPSVCLRSRRHSLPTQTLTVVVLSEYRENGIPLVDLPTPAILYSSLPSSRCEWIYRIFVSLWIPLQVKGQTTIHTGFRHNRSVLSFPTIFLKL